MDSQPSGGRAGGRLCGGALPVAGDIIAEAPGKGPRAEHAEEPPWLPGAVCGKGCQPRRDEMFFCPKANKREHKFMFHSQRFSPSEQIARTRLSCF